jgi:hypothetical protein
LTTESGKVAANQSINRHLSARVWNSFVDAARRSQERELSKDTGRAELPLDRDLIRIKNATGQTVKFGEVMGIDVAAVVTEAQNATEFKHRPVLIGKVPAAEHAGRFVVAAETIGDGRFGLAIASGMAMVRVDVTDELHHFAGPTVDDVTKLTSARAGAAQIIVPRASPAEQFYVVRLGSLLPADEIHFTLNAALETTDTLKLATVTRHSGGAHPDPMNDGVEVWNDGYFEGPSGAKGQAKLMSDGKYWISQLSCGE